MTFLVKCVSSYTRLRFTSHSKGLKNVPDGKESNHKTVIAQATKAMEDTVILVEEEKCELVTSSKIGSVLGNKYDDPCSH